MSGQPELAERISRVAVSISGVLAAGVALRALLQPGHPSLGEATADGGWSAPSLALGVAHYGNRASLRLWVMCRAVAALEHAVTQPPAAEVWMSCISVARAIDGVLVAGHGMRAALKLGHPSLGDIVDGAWRAAPLALGEARYGTTPLIAVWAMCCAVVALRFEWTGDAGPAVEPAPDEPDEAPGLTAEAPPPPDVGADQQPRLGAQA